MLSELAVLARLGDLPVAHVRPGTRPHALYLDYIEGIPATQAIESGLAPRVMRALGDALRAVQAVPMSRFGATASGHVVTHGDFAPYNVIVSEDGVTVRAVLNWEGATLGRPLTDVGWFQTQFLRLFPHRQAALRDFFDAYGQTPEPAAIAEAVNWYQMARSTGGLGTLAWPTSDFRVFTFSELREGAAFVGAVSRAAGAPFQTQPYDPPSEIWVVPAQAGGLRVWMNEPAATVAASVFAATPTGIEKILSRDARLAFLATHTAQLGLDDVLAIL